jgi:leader peptidase (prepilin peptidase) / N-methyltransferase
MKYSYLVYISIPLILYLIVVVYYELKTSLIMDKMVMPACIFFTSAPFLFKNSHWLSHISGMVVLLLFFLIAASIYRKITGEEGIGGGAIKLMASIGAAVGLEYSIQVALIFTVLTICSVVFARYKFGKDTLPSSPFALIAVLITVIFHQNISLKMLVG